MAEGGWSVMCTGGDGVPANAAEALAMMHAGVDYLLGPGLTEAGEAALADMLAELTVIGSKHSAAWNACLSRFDAANCHDADGYQTSAAWLAGKTRTDLTAARAQVRRMRQVTARPALDAAMAGGTITGSWARKIITWTRPLPPELRDEADRILLAAAEAGADLQDLQVLAARAVQEYKSTRPDPDDPDDSFTDRRLILDHTFGGAATLTGDLTPECAAVIRAICEALGKKHGAEDARTEGQRFHDALQEGCELLIRAKLVPDRAGSDTRVDAVISLAELRGMDGAAAIEDAWLAGLPGYLTGNDAEAISCDALIVPVVTGSCDWSVIAQMAELVLDAFAGDAIHGTGDAAPGSDGTGTGGQGGAAQPPASGEPAAKALPPQAWEALQYALAKLSIGFVSGPGGLASALRRGLLETPYNSRSVPLDVGWSEHIPEPIRRAVRLRDRHCRWPGGCTRPPAACDCHHVKHKKDGGPTSVGSCILLCQYHHDICVHRWGWNIELLPDGQVTATSPRGQVLRSRLPPGTTANPARQGA
ncbi:MAG TPA: DUF222 domain-containing protein [Trebonia sp.]